MNNGSIQQLQEIATSGNVAGSFTPLQTITYGSRMKNKYIRALVKKYQESTDVPDAKIIEMVLAMDQLIEEGTLTEELLKEINKDPSLLTK